MLRPSRWGVDHSDHLCTAPSEDPMILDDSCRTRSRLLNVVTEFGPRLSEGNLGCKSSEDGSSEKRAICSTDRSLEPEMKRKDSKQTSVCLLFDF